MELERYQGLLCAIEMGSLTAAAEKMGYTPSGISRMIAALENENGFPLLLRSKEGVVPSPECTRLLPAVREFIFRGESVQQLSWQIRSVTVGDLTIATAYSVYYSWISQVTSAFHRAYPCVQIKIINGYSSELLEQLNEHTVDLAIISEREGHHSWIPVCTDAVTAMVPHQHPLAKRKSVPVRSFAEEAYIDTYPGKDIDNARIFQRCGIQPNTQFSTMDIYATMSMVKAGLGISMNNGINTQQWAKDVCVLPLEPPQEVTIGIATAENASPVCRAFMEFARPFLAELTAEAPFV